jgi:hypothetical protein
MAGTGEVLLVTGSTRVSGVPAKIATGVPKVLVMSLESYPIPEMCTSAPNCRFVDLTLWISVECAEMAHKAGKKPRNRPMIWPLGQFVGLFSWR